MIVNVASQAEGCPQDLCENHNDIKIGGDYIEVRLKRILRRWMVAERTESSCLDDGTTCDLISSLTVGVGSKPSL